MAVNRVKTKTIRLKYDSTAEGYDELYRSEQYEKYSTVIKLFEETHGRLCDLGAGTLLLLEFLSKHGLTGNFSYYIALDISNRMLGIGYRRARELSAAHLVDIVIGDLENLPLRSKSCRLAAAFTVVDLTDNPMRAVEEVRRVAERAVVSLLKKAQTLRTASIRVGVFAGETAKDVILVV